MGLENIKNDSEENDLNLQNLENEILQEGDDIINKKENIVLSNDENKNDLEIQNSDAILKQKLIAEKVIKVLDILSYVSIIIATFFLGVSVGSNSKLYFTLAVAFCLISIFVLFALVSKDLINLFCNLKFLEPLKLTKSEKTLLFVKFFGLLIVVGILVFMFIYLLL